MSKAYVPPYAAPSSSHGSGALEKPSPTKRFLQGPIFARCGLCDGFEQAFKVVRVALHRNVYPIGGKEMGVAGWSHISSNLKGAMMAEEKKTYTFRCTVCGYEVTIDEPQLPDDYICPVCGVGPDMFELIEEG